MGCVKTITADAFPAQGSWAGKRARVCFHYDTSRQVYGRVVRDDREEPGRTIIRLDDGRFVEGSECQFSIHGEPFGGSTEDKPAAPDRDRLRDILERLWSEAECCATDHMTGASEFRTVTIDGALDELVEAVTAAVAEDGGG